MVVSVEIEVAEAARMMGVSAVRARQLAREGRLRARRVGGRWLVDVASLPSARRRGRPMSPRIGWALVRISEGRVADWVEPRESYRLRQALARLAADDEPELLLRSWLASRAERMTLSASEVDALRADPRLVVSGVSDERSGLSAAGYVEAYVRAQDAAAVRRDHLLIDAGTDANVVLHSVLTVPQRPVPVLLLAADLADHDGPRELTRARQLIADWSLSRLGARASAPSCPR
jgi:excisionase family DNA binding protein